MKSEFPFFVLVYALFHLMLAVGATVVMMKFQNMGWIASTLITAIVLSGLSCVGRVLDARAGDLRFVNFGFSQRHPISDWTRQTMNDSLILTFFCQIGITEGCGIAMHCRNGLFGV
jgi:hypothetical protein